MSPLADRRLTRLLQRAPTADPPPGLLEALRREIPEQPGLPGSSPRLPFVPRDYRRRYLAAAAGVFITLGGGWLAWQVDREGPGLQVAESRPSYGTISAEGQARDRGQVVEASEGEVVQGIAEAPRSEEPSAGKPQAVAREEREEPAAKPAPVAAEPEDQASALRQLRALGYAEASRDERLKALEPARPVELFQEAPPTSPRASRLLHQPGPPYQFRFPGAPEPEVEMPPSTGGTTEPNDQPWGDVFFRGHGVNPFVDTEDDPLSTFGLSVDTASYTVVRRYLQAGHLPPHEAVRLEEMVSYFRYGDAGPEAGDFALHAQGMPSPWPPGERYWLLRLGLQARQVERSERRPAVLTLVVDVSGSMAYGGRLEIVRNALELLAEELQPADRVALVSYDHRAQVLLAHGSEPEALRRALATLTPGGSTNAEAGLVTGYRLAREGFVPGASNRVVFLSDGVANVGRTGAGSILERIGEEQRRGIELTAVGVGMGNYNDALLEELARRARGRYVYVDTLTEAWRVFSEELTGQLETVAEEARAQVEFDPAQVARHRLLGYESRPMPHERFRDPGVPSGEIGSGHAVTALYELKLHPGAEEGLRPLALLRLRYRPAGEERFVELERPITFAELAGSWPEAPRELRLAAVVARFAEVLRGSYWARDADLDELLVKGREARAAYPENRRVAELVELMEVAARLVERERLRTAPR